MANFKDIKCIFLDIDNTLTNNNREITDYTKEVLTKLKKQNIYAIICTGRTNMYAIDKSKSANCTPIVIADNGSIIYDYEKDVTIYENCMSKDTIKKIWECSLKHEIDCVFNTKTSRYRHIKFESNQYIRKATSIDSLDKIKENVTQLVVSDSDYKKIKEFMKDINNIDCVIVNNTNVEEEYKYQDTYFCDINPKGSSKGNALNELKKYLNLKDSTMAFGDSANDLPIFENASISVSMINASEEIKKKTDFVTEYSNNEDGVAKFIEKYIIN